MTKTTRRPTREAPSIHQKSLSPGRFAAALDEELYQIALRRSAEPRPERFQEKEAIITGLAQNISARVRAWEKGGETSSPRKLAWLTWLARSQRLCEHLDTLVYLLLLAQGQAVVLRVSLSAQSSLYRVTRSGHQVSMELHEGFIAAPPDVLRALVETALSQRRSTRRTRLIQAFTDGPDFARIAGQLADQTDSPTLGRSVDLAGVFNAINQEYFGGKVPRPRLVWSRSATTRTLGKYQASTDTVTLNRGLDAPDVPAEVIRFVMYHELLHKVLGSRVVNGRHYGHTAEFRALEKRYAGYSAVQDWLKRNAGKLG